MKRLNWIDILIIVILVGALAFVGIRAIKKNLPKNDSMPDSTATTEVTEENPLSDPTLRVVVEVYDLTRELAENTVASFDGPARELDGEMVPMTRIFNSNRVVDGQITDWEILDTEEENMVTLRLTLECKPKVYRCNYSLGNQEFRIGKGYIIKTMSMEYSATIVSMTELIPYEEMEKEDA